MIDALSILDLSTPVHDIWRDVSAKYYPEDQIIRRGLSEEEVTSRVYRVRRKHYGSHWLVSSFKAKRRPNQNPHRILGWTHPQLRQILSYPGSGIFIDGTIRCVPRMFKQSFVLMAHDTASELNVSIYFVLCTGKSSDMYFDTLELIYRDISEKLQPSEIVCDFERPLIDAARKQFENAEIIGCLFHLKQAIQRRMIRREYIPEPEIRIAMEPGVLDMLTVVDPELVDPKGIRWVRRQIKLRCGALGIPYSKTKWHSFWEYFRSTWLNMYNVEEWNVHGFSNELIARTNKPLERFHRELNRAFPTPQPNVITFVTVIRRISEDYVAKLADISAGRRTRGCKKNTKSKASKKKGKGKQRKRSRRRASSGDNAHYNLPDPVDLQECEGLSETDSEDDDHTTFSVHERINTESSCDDSDGSINASANNSRGNTDSDDSSNRNSDDNSNCNSDSNSGRHDANASDQSNSESSFSPDFSFDYVDERSGSEWTNGNNSTHADYQQAIV